MQIKNKTLFQAADEEAKALHKKNKEECIKELLVEPETLNKIAKKDFGTRDMKVEVG